MPPPGALNPPHLTQIAAWTGAAWLLTHNNAITAFWSSPPGAGGCCCHPGTKPLPSGSPSGGGCGSAGWLGRGRGDLTDARASRGRDPETQRKRAGTAAAFATSPMGRGTGGVTVLGTSVPLPGSPLPRPSSPPNGPPR